MVTGEIRREIVCSVVFFFFFFLLVFVVCASFYARSVFASKVSVLC
jgi:hypothetical protein